MTTYAPREVAWRLFAAEFNESRLQHQDGGERTPEYIVTPLGALVNRVFVVGVLTTCEQAGENLDTWRAQVADPTGVFHLYAGPYQPEASKALADLEPPAIVAVAGKARMYRPEEGVVYLSVRPEAITRVDVQQRDQWILEASKHTIDRIEALAQAQELQAPTADTIARALDVAPNHARGIELLMAAGSKADLGRYRALVADALTYVLPAGPAKPAPRLAVAAAAGGTAAVVASGNGDTGGDPSEAILGWIEKHDDGDGTTWEALVAAAGKARLDEAALEEAVNDLMDQGRLFEPVLGRFKLA